MREYELLYLVGESKSAEIDRIRTDVEKLCAGEGVTFLEEETTEQRKLAYSIGKESRGTYVARRFTLPENDEMLAVELEKLADKDDAIKVITKKLRLYKDVIRFLILRADDLPELLPIARVERPKTVPSRGGYRNDRNAPRRIEASPARREAPAVTAASVAETSKEEGAVGKESEVVAPKMKKEEEKTVTAEDIDKKLEEVLNI